MEWPEFPAEPDDQAHDLGAEDDVVDDTLEDSFEEAAPDEAPFEEDDDLEHWLAATEPDVAGSEAAGAGEDADGWLRDSLGAVPSPADGLASAEDLVDRVVEQRRSREG